MTGDETPTRQGDTGKCMALYEVYEVYGSVWQCAA